MTRYASILIAGVLIAGNVVAAPNLTLNQPSGWSDKIVVSKVTGTTTDSSPLLPTDNLYVDFSVINNGSNAVTVTFATRLYVDGNLRTTATTNPPLNSGVDTRLIDFPIETLSAGTHTIRVVIDSGNSIAEGNEGDNDFTKTITVSNPTPPPGQPNLTLNQPSGWLDKIVVSKVTGTTTDSSPLLPTDNLYVDFSVINNGSSAAAVSFATRLYVDGNLRTTATTNPPLNPGVDTRLIDFPIGTLSAGTHTIRVVIDSGNAIAESNEGDNDFTKTITVSNPTPTPGQPNLTLNQPSGWSDKIVVSTVTGTTTDSSPLVPTDSLYVDFSVINNGSSSATVTFATRLYVDGSLRTTASTAPPLNPGVDTRLIDFPIGTLTAGTHTIRVVIDSGNAIAESNEGDNVFTKTITVSNPTPTPGQPNLTLNQPSGWSDKIVVSKVTGTTTDSSPWVPTDSLYVDFSVINNGSSAATATFATQLYVDGNLRTTATTAPPLNPGVDTRLIDFPIGTLSAGTHTIRVVIDSGNAIAESNEGDNDFTKSITVSNPTPTSPTPTPTPSPSATPTSTPTITPTATPSTVQVFLSLHSLRADAISNVFNAGVDDPLLPVPDETRLGASQPFADKGLVADDVTPLLIEIDSLPAPTRPTTFNITANITGGSLRTGGLELNTLHHPASGAANFSTNGTVVLSPAHPTAFAYISAVRCEDVQQDLTVNLIVQQTDSPSNIKQLSFKIRKPPVVLVHGFDSSSDAWSSAFLSELNKSRHAAIDASDTNFVVRIDYGVDAESKDPTFRNRTGSLVSLAQDLDSILSSQVETINISGVGTVGTFREWAITRYDVICHSQGGVLARMLCATDAATKFGVSRNFKNSSNLNRGRFRRIVTIGSPQNGSTLAYYANRVLDKVQFDLDPLRALIRSTLIFRKLLQPKFDPFGVQIRSLNDPSRPVDRDAKFHLIRGAIVGFAPILYGFYLDNSSISSVVIPRGSDGVVDFDSATARMSGGSVETMAGNVAHASPAFAFGVPEGSTETALATVASKAMGCLDGPANSVFAPFEPPLLLSADERAAIDAVVPGVGFADVFSVRSSVNRLIGSPTELPGTQVAVTLTPDAGEPLNGQATWMAEAYGSNGVSTTGIIIQVDAADSTKADIIVADGVQGDVVVYGSYPSGTGKLIFGKPLVVLSNPVAANLIGISLEPESVAVSVNDHFRFQIWGSYDNGQRARLYEPVGDAAQYSSADSSIISVGTDAQLTANHVGTAIIHATFRGFTAQSTVIVKDPFASHLANISTRLNVGTGDNAMIGGFIITGTQPKKVLVRGIGPSLNLPGKLGNPTLELYQGNTLLESNDDWQQSPNKQGIIDSTIPPTNDLEAAIVATLPANNSGYTAIFRGANNEGGVGLVEAYDLDPTVGSKLANISTRGFVDRGDDVMIGGSIVSGSNPANVLFRAIGPSLSSSGVANPLQDPVLELHDSNGASIAVNDNWRDAQEAAIISTTIPPADNRESAILTMLPPGAYTAVVRGKDDSIGVALVEAYQLQ